VEPTRPVFGPALKRLGRTRLAGGTPADMLLRRCRGAITAAAAPLRLRHVERAAQLTRYAVRRTAIYARNAAVHE
jgi:hypothetical protein